MNTENTMAAATPRTAKSLLLGSLVAGPLYMIISLLQAATRANFSLSRHPLSLLTQGDMGWLQVTNFIVTGLLTTAGAFGMRRVLTAGIGRFWGPLLIGVFGLSFIGAGLFKPDPALGFPPGTPADAISISSTGIAHFAIGGLGFLAFIAACFVFARRFGSQGERRWMLYSVATGLIFLAAFAGIMSGGGQAWAFIGFLLGVSMAWLWLSLLSAQLQS